MNPLVNFSFGKKKLNAMLLILLVEFARCTSSLQCRQQYGFWLKKIKCKICVQVFVSLQAAFQTVHQSGAISSLRLGDVEISGESGSFTLAFLSKRPRR